MNHGRFREKVHDLAEKFPALLERQPAGFVTILRDKKAPLNKMSAKALIPTTIVGKPYGS